MPYLGSARVYVIDYPEAGKNLDICTITSGLRMPTVCSKA